MYNEKSGTQRRIYEVYGFFVYKKVSCTYKKQCSFSSISNGTYWMLYSTFLHLAHFTNVGKICVWRSKIQKARPTQSSQTYCRCTAEWFGWFFERLPRWTMSVGETFHTYTNCANNAQHWQASRNLDSWQIVVKNAQFYWASNKEWHGQRCIWNIWGNIFMLVLFVLF